MDIEIVTTRFKDKQIEELPSPCFLIDLNKVKKNCETHLSNAEQFQVKLRPHMKTHKTIKLGALQTGNTKKSIVVSSLAEARHYSSHGFSDILYGVPLGVDKVDYVYELNRLFPDADISVMVDNQEIVEKIVEKAEFLKEKPFGAFLKVNCDNGRAGVWWNCEESIKLAQNLSNSNVPLKGIYAHCGNTYSSNGDVSKIKSIANLTAERILEFREKSGLNHIPVGIGSTPTCSVACDVSDPELTNLTKLDEFHPGNYVLYDLMQVSIGSCTEEEVAGIVLCRVLSIQKDESVIVDCGFTGISKQGVGSDNYDKLNPVRRLVNGKFEKLDIRIEGLSQEHGRLVGEGCKGLAIGDILGVLPWHSCAVGALHPWFYLVEDGKCVDVLVPVRGWM